MSVEVIDKPVCQTCPHQTDAGCAIYEDRPEPCRTFTCLWQAGDRKVLGDAERPDKIQAFFTWQPTPGGKPRVACHVLDPDVAYKGRVLSAIRKYIKKLGLVMVVCDTPGKEGQKLYRKGDL
jgi:hypothetical protein